jgi:hypothetical protein
MAGSCSLVTYRILLKLVRVAYSVPTNSYQVLAFSSADETPFGFPLLALDKSTISNFICLFENKRIAYGYEFEISVLDLDRIRIQDDHF